MRYGNGFNREKCLVHKHLFSMHLIYLSWSRAAEEKKNR
jgi:hypothetical protein